MPSTVHLSALHESQERQEATNVSTDPDLAQAIGLCMKDWGDGVWSVRCASSPSHQPGNQVTGIGPEDILKLSRYTGWFDEVGCEMYLRWPGPAVSKDVGVALAEHGLLANEVEAWMSAAIDALPHEVPAHEVHEVRTASRMQDFGAAFCRGWGIPEGLTRRIALAAMTPLPGPDHWHRYVAYVDGEPAAEALLVMFGDLAYLAEASTDPRFRKRGLQRALIARRAHDARSWGATRVFGGVQYGDQSWSNMRALGLREESITVTFRRAAK